MNKYVAWILGLVLIVALISAGGTVGEILNPTTATKDIEITYPTEKLGDSLTKTDMMKFDDISYEVKGNTIILNKLNVFQNREIVFTQNQECLTWSEPTCKLMQDAYCKTYGEMICIKWEERPLSVCLKPENPEEPISEKNPCLEWSDKAPEGCLEYDQKTGTCNKWEEELTCLETRQGDCIEIEPAKCIEYNPASCLTMSKYDTNYFIQQAIKNELELVQAKQTERSTRTDGNIDIVGKVLIK